MKLRSYTYESRNGPYEIEFHKPPAASVELVDATSSSVSTIYYTTRAYKGIYDLSDTDGYTTENAFSDIQNTKLQTPLEMVHMLWLLKDVTRAFTHQLVRYRVGTAFVQESMRFLNHKGVYRILETGLNSDESKRQQYEDTVCTAINTYENLIASGVPAEDARGVLPTNIMTNIFFDCSLRTLQAIFPQRLCCQAQQGEWQPILREMRSLIRAEMGEQVEELLKAPYEKGQSCGYRASFDRPCVWSNKDNE